MHDKLITIIVPVYNTEKFLERCLDSLINQVYKNIEIICINDGSTDTSLDILNRYAKMDNRVKVFNQINQGISAARNTGLKNSKGDIIAFVDSDDWLDISTLKIAFDEMSKENVDIVLWPYKREYSSGSYVTELFDAERKKWDENDIKVLYRMMVGPIHSELKKPEGVDRFITVWGKLYRRDIVENVQFINTEKIGTQEDLLYNLSVLKNAKSVLYISNTYYHYRKSNDKSFTHQYKDYLVNRWQNLYEIIESEIISATNCIELKVALNNRICCGLIGLGLNLAEDKSLSLLKKRKELLRIFNLKYYKKALLKLDCKYMPIYWKTFFVLAKHRQVTLLCVLLLVMNKIRG